MKRGLFNHALRVLLFTNALILLAGAMLGPIYALFVEEVGGGLIEASFSVGIFALAAGGATLIFGKLSDKTRKKKGIVALGYLIIAAGFFLYTQVSGVMTLFIVQAVIGFGEALYVPSFDALYSKNVTKTKAGREWGAWEATNYFSVAIEPLSEESL